MTSSADIEIPDHTVGTLLQCALGLAAPLNTNIHKNDQMLSFVESARVSEFVARSMYLTSGAQLLAILEQFVRWKFGSFDKLSSFLDFASGYGRLTRFLVQKLPPDRIWVSDIQADAVAYQQAEFGVNGFVSTTAPADLACDQTFDCIFVASLFSHLPAATFAPWLKKLCSLLKPGGLLIFSVHAENRLPSGHTMPDSGMWFSEASEIASVDTKDYGLAVVTEAFVRNAIVAATGYPVYERIQHALIYQQDIYLVVNEPAADFSSLDFHYLPHGDLDYGLLTPPDELCLRGWAADITGSGSSVEVQVFVDGRMQQKSASSTYRPDLGEHFKDDRFLYAGWDCCGRLANNDPSQMVLVKLISAHGIESILYLGTLASLFPVGRVDLCVWTGPGELYLKGWVADIIADESPVEVQVLVNNQARQKCLPYIYRPDLREHFRDDRFSYAGWVCNFHLHDDNLAQLIEVKGVLPDGAESILYSGTIATLLELPLTAVDTVAVPSEFDERLRQLKVELDRRFEYIRHLEEEVERKNAAVADLETRLRLDEQRFGLRRLRWPWHRRSPRR